MPDPITHFETHLTVSAAADAAGRLRAWAGVHDLKCTHILLDAGRTPSQPMLTRRGRGTLASELAAATALADKLRADGFDVVRTKLEVEAGTEPPYAEGYFECHIKVVDHNNNLLRQIAAPHRAHVSRNARRTDADGRTERFLTQRCRNVSREAAHARFTELLGALSDFEVLSTEEEFVVYDDNPATDAGWISQEWTR